ncbi:hypothetical protein [Seleniivibrio woodruffii]|uniref:Uncharacterized protein n=1 Tax=Seleniivibrio woodruffii TaxID=1078050 RepID=A0A4R1K8D5_9BACT|nr:hypothetical protein [Seleniivibrio woodruffii]TCK59369.1 hypothetical protein C8D98_2302 [Seleniivibrio woodruffii]TVZ35592.1 hypothetical protein OF66_1207 [Seleniivibrio woodruffii]
MNTVIYSNIVDYILSTPSIGEQTSPGKQKAEDHAEGSVADSGQYIAGQLVSMILAAAERSPLMGSAVKNRIEDPALSAVLTDFFGRIVSVSGGVRDGLKLMREFEKDSSLLHDTACMAVSAARLSTSIRSFAGVSSSSSPLHRFLLSSVMFYPVMRSGSGCFPAFSPSEGVRRAAGYCGGRYCLPDAMFREDSRVSSDVRYVVTFHIFIRLLENNGFTAFSQEAHRNMRYLADSGYADSKAVSWLGILFSQGCSGGLMEFAARLQSICMQKPLVWGTAGSGTPLRMFCSNGSCVHAIGKKVHITGDIYVRADREYRTNIKQGEYRQCSKLTPMLEDYHRAATA